jgi:hypothetical protein
MVSKDRSMITREHITLTATAGAIFSDCEQYRYRLWREWDTSLPSICFLMLNPSTADADTDDPTITRCINRAVAMGYGRIEVANLFPLRATDPADLLMHPNPIGPVGKADGAILDVIERCTIVICAWGAHCAAAKRAGDVLHILRVAGFGGHLHHLGLNKDGNPKHPLYIAMKVKPTRFEI